MDVFMEEQEQLPSRGGLGNTEETAEAAGAAHDVRAELTPTARRVLSEMQVIEVIPYSRCVSSKPRGTPHAGPAATNNA
jgi:hypothetical protein